NKLHQIIRYNIGLGFRVCEGGVCEIAYPLRTSIRKLIFISFIFHLCEGGMRIAAYCSHTTPFRTSTRKFIFYFFHLSVMRRGYSNCRILLAYYPFSYFYSKVYFLFLSSFSYAKEVFELPHIAHILPPFARLLE
ncbi:Unknown protein, partial [Striga hermonthica]